MKTNYLRPSLVALGLLAVCSAASLAAGEESQAALKTQAKVTEAEAAKTALGRVPGGSIKEAELEKEGGKLIWSFDIATPQSRNITEVQVDAKSGNIISTEVETPADQAKEAKDDEKEKR